ncbi:MAG: hypothetical protein JZD41_02125 [Thermoproteus sp.]|nr:hypothetical protein [Thermoproteus sp.]
MLKYLGTISCDPNNPNSFKIYFDGKRLYARIGRRYIRVNYKNEDGVLSFELCGKIYEIPYINDEKIILAKYLTDDAVLDKLKTLANKITRIRNSLPLECKFVVSSDLLAIEMQLKSVVSRLENLIT